MTAGRLDLIAGAANAKRLTEIDHQMLAVIAIAAISESETVALPVFLAATTVMLVAPGIRGSQGSLRCEAERVEGLQPPAPRAGGTRPAGSTGPQP